MSQFAGLYISISGMAASKAAMETASHNMSNVTTPGYTRQQVMLSASNATQSASFNGKVGMGVKVDGIRRVTDSYLEARVQREQATADNWSTQSGLLNKIETSMTALNLPKVFSNFWDAWHSASLNPEQENTRYEVKQQAESLIFSLKSASSQLQDIEQEITDDIGDQIKLVNNMSEEIAMLNKEIKQGILKGQQPNDLLDKRATLLREFVGITGATVINNSDETVTITIPGASGDIDLVDGLLFTEMTTADVSEVTNGKLYGLVQVIDSELQEHKNFLDQLAQDLALQVNALHANGYKTDGSQGGDFFTTVADPANYGVEDLALSADVEGDINKIAVHGKITDPVTGDETTDLGATAQSIYDLRTNIAKAVSSFIGEIGSAAKSATFQDTSHQDMIDEMDSLMAEVSGVSIDEELANIMQYQRAYEASAKVLTIMDSLLETLINIVR